MKRRGTSFIEWEPALTTEEVFSDMVGLGEIHTDRNKLYWLEMRPSEQGRYVIVQKDGDKILDMTPGGVNVRTRVHEYGGGAYTVCKGDVYFVNFVDQRLYCQPAGSKEIIPLTPERNRDGSLGKYAAPVVSPDGKTLLFVYEKEYAEKENENFLAVLTLGSQKISEPKIIARGADFYADPLFSPDGDKVAWLQWSHPSMPWDSTQLMMGRFDNDSLQNVKKIDGGKGCSVCMPRFDRNGRLYYVKDEIVDDTSSPLNWWNIYCFQEGTERITSEQAEFGEPLWVFNQSCFDFLPDGCIIAKMVKEQQDYLVILDPETKSLLPIETGLSHYSYIRTDDMGRVYFIGANAEKGPSVYSFDIRSGKAKNLKSNSKIRMKKRDISPPEPITYPTKDKSTCHAYFYAPKNSRYSAAEDEKPPLLVIAHGGPTHRTKGIFSLIIQFFTSAGFAVADIDYRGSTGYGRKYRDALLKKWGVIDAEDVADGVRYLSRQGRIDASMVAVRGGSAGGYMVQRVMTRYPRLFTVGASYFGIGNLITITEETHKFESRYIDNLVGARLPQGKKRYDERSPINYLDRLSSPMIIFQGSDDKIVTPDCSREVAEALKKRGIPYEYVEYKGESHGFRTKKNNVDSLSKEFSFYREVFRERKDQKK